MDPIARSGLQDDKRKNSAKNAESFIKSKFVQRLARRGGGTEAV